jgi:signal transduction histidine kinase
MLRANNSSPKDQILPQDSMTSVVHDLRTPMTIIKGNLQLLLSGVMGQMTEEQQMLIQRSVGPLEDMILMTENLLQSATLEKSDLTLKLEETDLDKLLSDTIDFYAMSFKQREMQIFRDGNTFGQKLRIDTFWMKRVLSNLIWNAYKFTPDHGKVVIQVNPRADGLDLIIEDNGRGIPADKLGTIFQKFTQVSPSKDRKLGTGLGLWICKRILELHGGSIRVESEEGKGSRFILFIPSRCIL